MSYSTGKGDKPEERVRKKVIADLTALGWPEKQLRWKPEWRIPHAPHDLTKRERGQNFATCGSADLVAFSDSSAAEWFTLQIIFEFKAPDIDAGRAQLMRYLGCEPMVKMGYWTNGKKTLAIYKSHTADWVFDEDAPLPRPDDDLTKPSPRPPTWNTLKTPQEVELRGALLRLVATTVVSETRSTRRESQLNELIHILLVKLNSDAYATNSKNRNKPVSFRVYGAGPKRVKQTADQIRDQFRGYFEQHGKRIFHPNDHGELALDDETIYSAVLELAPFRILGDNVEVLARAFQIFRTDALKSKEGQYLTPLRIVRPAIMALEITSRDKVIDPACGTGTFLVEALWQVMSREFPDAGEDWSKVKWSNDNLYGVDKDEIGTKLTRAIMVAVRDGSSHILLGDSVATHLWKSKYQRLDQELGRDTSPFVTEQFTVVVTNPPFGESLKVKASECRAAKHTISQFASTKGDYPDLEIGLVYLEMAHRLLRLGGRVGIVLPETYFFSSSYRWLTLWLHDRFVLRGMLNIPMEAFEEFCRAKTNFYIFEKVGAGHKSVAAAAAAMGTP